MNLKPYLDAVNAANEKVLATAQEIDAVFQEGPEGPEKAYAMKPQLDGAMAEAARAQELYQAMQRVPGDGGAAARFVPVSGEKPAKEGKKLARAEWLKLSFSERRQFFQDGGQLVSDEESAE